MTESEYSTFVALAILCLAATTLLQTLYHTSVVAYGQTGTVTEKSTVLYDSGWIDIADKRGNKITLAHNLNISDWNDPSILVDISGKTALDSNVIQRTSSVVLWNKTYGGSGWDGAFSLISAEDGGFVLAGSTPHAANGLGVQFLLMRLDSKGNNIWSRTYGGGGGARALVKASDGGYTLAGTTSPVAGTVRACLVHADSNGNELWNRTYGETNDDEAVALVEATGGGYAFAGSTRRDFWLVRTDSNGNVVWSRTFGGAGSEQAYALVQTKDGGFALAGTTDSYGAGLDDVWLVRTDSNGDLLWNITYGGGMYEEARALVQTSDGDFAIAGSRDYFGVNGSDFWLVRTDANGALLWNRTYGGRGSDEALILVQTGDGGFAIAGDTTSFGAGLTDSWLVRTDFSGIMLWNKTYGGVGTEIAYAVIQTGSGGFALAGCTDSWGAGNYDSWLLQTDARGNVLTLFQVGLALIGTSANTVTLYRSQDDADWNYVRVRIVGLYTEVSVGLSVSPTVVAEGRSVNISVSTNPLQANGVTTIEYSIGRIFWHNITSFAGGSGELLWTPNVTGCLYVRALWSTSWVGGVYSSNKTASFTVDATPPSLAILSPLPGSTVKTSTFSASWRGSDETAGIDHYEIRKDQEFWVNTGLKTACQFYNVEDGNHTISVKAVDKVGLSETKKVQFRVDASPKGDSELKNIIIALGLIMAVAQVIGIGIYFLKKKTKKPPRV